MGEIHRIADGHGKGWHFGDGHHNIVLRERAAQNREKNDVGMEVQSCAA
jgi:hypothetical protein